MPPGLRAALERLGLDFPTLRPTRLGHLARIRSHGIRLVTGTDAGISPAKAHGGVAFAVLDLVAAGYPVAEALATATSGAADVVRARRRYRPAAPGLAADLLVVDGDLTHATPTRCSGRWPCWCAGAQAS